MVGYAPCTVELLIAFETPTGLPYGSINLKYGVSPGETPITCTSCCASYIVEFGVLSRLTGNYWSIQCNH